MSFPYHSPPLQRRGIMRTAVLLGAVLVAAAPWWFGLYEIARAVL